ncbi:MAG: hypothetical protein LBQ22_05575 [Bacteroidales bacterium]|nr:hypothetical protein [Bacteroidales bacterium]
MAHGKRVQKDKASKRVIKHSKTRNMKVVVLLSKTFFKYHFRGGEANNFAQKVLDREKKHTCRKNYEYWKDIIDRLNEKGGVLSVRQWIGMPYHKPGQEVIIDIPAELVGVQKLELRREKVETYDELTNVGTYYYDWTAKVEGRNTPVELIAANDGLTLEEFKAWFAPVFDEAEKKYPEFSAVSNATILDFAIIHFTKERY